MAIRKRGNGWQIDYFDPTGKRVRKSFTKKKDAEAELAKRVSLIAEKRYLDVKKDYTTTLDEVLKKYEENFQDQDGFKNSKCHFIENFREYFGKDTKLANIKYIDLDTYRSHLKRKPTRHDGFRSPTTVNREITCLHHVFEKAKEWQMLERSPFEQGKSLLTKENNQRLRFLTEDEISALLRECTDYLRPIVACALNTGMRRGEILSLQWDQIRNGFIYLSKTKTNEARQIPVNDAMEVLFADIRRSQGPGAKSVFTFTRAQHALKHPENPGERKGLALVVKTVQSIRTGFLGACKRAGIENFRFHDLRHTFASQLVMKGANLKEVQELLGHKNIAMTMRYAHLSQESKRKAVNLLNGLTKRGDRTAPVTKVSQKENGLRCVSSTH
ncbi:MAG: site-specific integrase [Syntrophobacteraceae bacterium]|jgi:integrase